jgi:uncharacterized protein (AIM24 family)
MREQLQLTVGRVTQMPDSDWWLLVIRGVQNSASYSLCNSRLSVNCAFRLLRPVSGPCLQVNVTFRPDIPLGTQHCIQSTSLGNCKPEVTFLTCFSCSRTGHGIVCYRTGHGIVCYRTGHGIVCYRTGHGIVCYRTGHGTVCYRTGHGTVCYRTGHGIVCYRTGHGTVCYRTGHGIVCYRTGHGIVCYRTGHGTVCYRTCHGIVCYRTGHGIVCYRTGHGTVCYRTGHGTVCYRSCRMRTFKTVQDFQILVGLRLNIDESSPWWWKQQNLWNVG